MNWSRKEGKTFWKLLGKLDGKKDDDVFKKSISGERWATHFESIFTAKPEVYSALPPNTEVKGQLDYEITIEEINLGAYILRNGKAPGLDNISNEMITCLLSIKPEAIKAIFNAVLLHPTVIENWNTSMILPIHKKRVKNEPGKLSRDLINILFGEIPSGYFK